MIKWDECVRLCPIFILEVNDWIIFYGHFGFTVTASHIEMEFLQRDFLSDPIFTIRVGLNDESKTLEYDCVVWPSGKTLAPSGLSVSKLIPADDHQNNI